jgi:hypothetical protein
VTSDPGDERPSYGPYYAPENPPTPQEHSWPQEQRWPQESRGYPDQPYGGQRGYGSPPGPQRGYGDQQGPGGQQGYGDQRGYPGQRGYGDQRGYEDHRGGYEGYATSRVYGAPRQPPPDSGGGGQHRGRGRRRGAVLITSVVAVVAVIVAAVVVVVVRGHGGKPVTGFVPTGSTPGQDAQQITTAFLTAWQGGNLAKAASYTDDPAAAQAAMAAFGRHLGLRKLTATYQTARAAPASTASAGASVSASPGGPREAVTYSAAAGVSAPYQGQPLTGTWTYHAHLVAYQQSGSPAWYIAWRPDVLAPNLTTTTYLGTVAVPPKVSQVTDANGQVLTKYGDPGLATINGLLSQQAPPGQGGSPGLDVQIVTAKGTPVTNSQAVIVAPNNIPTLSTTISPQAEQAARSAVAMHKNSAMLVIQPSTGQILAIANNAGFNDFALTAKVAPGSTMKVITSTALFNSGAITPSTPVACPVTYTVQSITYHNDKNETLPASTPFSEDFAQSCNNAFSQQWPKLTGSNSLAATAKQYYGLDQKWSIGIPGASASYFNAPASASGSELAQEAFGEGQLTASPIAMASVAATVDTGKFKQPILLAHQSQVTAAPLPATTQADLKQVMRAVVTSGTAAGLGFGPNVYAKTGTADIQGQDQPNSWLVAFDPSKDVAVACLVVNAGYGAQFAGPEVASFLTAY